MRFIDSGANSHFPRLETAIPMETGALSTYGYDAMNRLTSEFVSPSAACEELIATYSSQKRSATAVGLVVSLIPSE